jgi:hypothetical protein
MVSELTATPIQTAERQITLSYLGSQTGIATRPGIRAWPARARTYFARAGPRSLAMIPAAAMIISIATSAAAPLPDWVRISLSMLIAVAAPEPGNWMMLLIALRCPLFLKNGLQKNSFAWPSFKSARRSGSPFAAFSGTFESHGYRRLDVRQTASRMVTQE